MDYKEVGDLVWAHGGASIMTILKAVGLGLVVAVLLILLYARLGVFRQRTTRLHGWVVKLWIPYVLLVAVFFAVKSGMVHAARNVALAANDRAVELIYEQAVTPLLGDTDKRATTLAMVQASGDLVRGLGDAINAQLKERVAPRADAGAAERMGSYLARKVMDHYQDDISAAVIYGVYQKTEGHLQPHSSSNPTSFEDFRAGMDLLLHADIHRMEGAIRTNLGQLTARLVHSQYRSILQGTLLIAFVLLLLPLVEWAAHRWWSARRQRTAVENRPEQGAGT